MAILGIAIQSRTGIPLYLETWSEKLSGFRMGSPILISGFLAAVSSFASNFKQNISYIRLHPMDYEGDPFGIDAVYTFIGNYMILIFVDPYQFHGMVKYKIDWLYGTLSQYEEMIKIGKVPQLSDQELQFINDILQDTVAWNIIHEKKEQLDSACESIMQEEYPEDVAGIFITSFDNTILYSYGTGRDEVEIYLNNIGSRGHGLEDREILHNYVSLPGLEPKLVVMANPGVKLQISDILGNGLVGQGGVPYYYYMITDANCAIGPIVESLIEKFNSILI